MKKAIAIVRNLIHKPKVMILDTIAMIIGYIVIAGIGIIALVVIVAAIFGHHRELNNRIYEDELRARGLDPHIDPKFM